MNKEKLEDFSLNQLMRRKFRVCMQNLSSPILYSIIIRGTLVFLSLNLVNSLSQEKKKVLKAKADADAELQKRASISIPLVDEKKEDIKRARATEFASGSPLSDCRKRRREIKSQSVFGDAYSPGGSKRAREAVLKTGVKLDGSIFGRGKELASSSSGSVGFSRQSLGIRTTSSSKPSSSSSSSLS